MSGSGKDGASTSMNLHNRRQQTTDKQTLLILLVRVVDQKRGNGEVSEKAGLIKGSGWCIRVERGRVRSSRYGGATLTAEGRRQDAEQERQEHGRDNDGLFHTVLSFRAVISTPGGVCDLVTTVHCCKLCAVVSMAADD